MIVADAFQIRDRATGRFLQWTIVDSHVPNRVVGAEMVHGRPARWGFVWQVDPCQAGIWTLAYVDRFLASPQNWTRELDGIDMERVPGPTCGCCGKLERGEVDGTWGVVNRAFRVRGVIHWRCAKHVGRNPCCIEGCGKTFAVKSGDDGRGAEDYSWRIMCGRCWRQAPKWMRDRVSRIRRLTKRRGWTDQLHRLHSMAWDACFRRIVRARSAPEAAEPAATPPPPALLAELESLGF